MTSALPHMFPVVYHKSPSRPDLQVNLSSDNMPKKQQQTRGQINKSLKTEATLMYPSIKWDLLDPAGSRWTLLGPVGPCWTLLEPDGPCWTPEDCQEVVIAEMYGC